MSEAGPDTEAVVGAAGGDGQEHHPGLAELSTVSVLNGDWAQISVEQRGPDGSEVIGGIALFASCPVCWAVVPLPTEQMNFMLEHSKWHIKQARDWDQINFLIEALQQAETD